MQAQDGLAVDMFCCASLVAQSVKNLPAMQEMWVQPWVGKITWKRAWQLQYSCRENPKD